MSNKYIKKPIIIDAFQYGVDEKPGWFLEKVKTNDIKTYCGVDLKCQEDYYCEIKTLEGVIRGNCFDYIIKGVKGEIYPCKPDIFNMTYSIYTTDNI
jgi:hypothetical protein